MGTETDDQRGQPHAIAAPVFPWFPPHHPILINNIYPPITPYLPSLTTALPWRETPTTCKLLHLIGRYPLLERRFPCSKGVSLVCWCFFLFGKVFPCLEVSHHANPKPPSKFPRKPKPSATLFHVERWFSLGYRGLCSWLPYTLA